MIDRSFYLHWVDALLAVGGVLAISTAGSAQTTNPELSQLLHQANQATEEGWELVREYDSQLQQQEFDLSYACYTLGDDRACLELQAFYQRRIRGYEAGIQYWQDLQNNGWADSFDH